ncbi:MAG: head GIN domain-containing protein [Chitinophagaceae bacterium]
MRKYLLMLALSAFVAITVSAQDSKDKPKIEGSGNVITKDIAVTSFDQLNVQGVFSVLLTQGDKEGVKIEADDNLQSLFEVKNEGSTLSVVMKENVNFNRKKKMKVYITFKKLKSMNLKTVGDITSASNMNFDDLKISNKSVGEIDLKMTAKTLDLDNKSVGKITFNGKADNAVIRNKGVGQMNAGDFVVQTMDIENTGVGSAEVNAAKELKIKDNLLGKVTNKGSATPKRLAKASI